MSHKELLTKKLKDGQDCYNNNKVGDSIKVYEEIINYQLNEDEQNDEDMVKYKE